MKLNRAGLLAIVFILLMTVAGAAFAQARDSDGDTVPDTRDRCPTQAGPVANGGCPDRPADDRDGDGVADFVDQCPDQPGTGFTNGCPLDITPIIIPDQNQGPQVVMIWSDMSKCMVGVPMNTSDPVNVREDPTISAPVLGQLFPGDQFAPWFRDYDENDDVWFGGAPVNGTYGWVKGDVVIDNGMCVNLPMVIHVDAPGDPAIEAEFDPSLIPQLDPESSGDWWDNIPPLVLVDLSQLPTLDLPTLEPIPPSPPSRFPFHLGDRLVDPESHGIIAVLLPDDMPGNAPGAPLDAFIVLPEFGDGEGQCSDPAAFIGGLQDFVSAPDTNSILIGLLLPAVQKVRAVADGWVGTEEFLASHFFGFEGADGLPTESLSLNFTRLQGCDTWIFIPTYMPDGSLMTETLDDGTIIICLAGFIVPCV